MEPNHRSLFYKLLSVIFLLLFAASLVSHADAEVGGKVRITLLTFNDIYEIGPVSGGKEGGLARVAALRQRLIRNNPNTLTLLAGDIFSPSAIGNVKVDGEPLAGRQMVDVLNRLGLDYATFGNHEFDIKRDQFYTRIGEARFSWISSNVRDERGGNFPGVEDNRIVTVKDKVSGKSVKIGIFGVTLPSNKPDYVSYKDPIRTAGEQVKLMRSKADILIAMTHLSIEDDERLAQAYPDIDLILGGHEHENYQIRRGKRFTPILKADANVRSVYVVDLDYDVTANKLEINTSLLPVNDTMQEDPGVALAVKGWVDKASAAIRETGLDPDRVVAKQDRALDGLEANVRSGETNLTRPIVEAMLKIYPDAQLSILNSGSVRIDDIIPPGDLTVYDIIRVLPFGGYVNLVSMKGSLLKRVLDQGEANRGTGGYLQKAGTRRGADGLWQINGVAIDASSFYKVAISDFLLTGKEQNLEFLNILNSELTVIEADRKHELRQAVIDFMSNR